MKLYHKHHKNTVINFSYLILKTFLCHISTYSYLKILLKKLELYKPIRCKLLPTSKEHQANNNLFTSCSSSSLTHSITTVHPTSYERTVRMVSYVLLSDFFSRASKQTFGLWKVGRRLLRHGHGGRGRSGQAGGTVGWAGAGSIVKDDLIYSAALSRLSFSFMDVCDVMWCVVGTVAGPKK